MKVGVLVIGRAPVSLTHPEAMPPVVFGFTQPALDVAGCGLAGAFGNPGTLGTAGSNDAFGTPGTFGTSGTLGEACAALSSYATRLTLIRGRGVMLSEVMLPPKPPQPSVMAGSSPVIWRMGIIADSAAITRETLPTLTSESQLTSNARFDPRVGMTKARDKVIANPKKKPRMTLRNACVRTLSRDAYYARRAP